AQPPAEPDPLPEPEGVPSPEAVVESAPWARPDEGATASDTAPPDPVTPMAEQEREDATHVSPPAPDPVGADPAPTAAGPEAEDLQAMAVEFVPMTEPPPQPDEPLVVAEGDVPEEPAPASPPEAPEGEPTEDAEAAGGWLPEVVEPASTPHPEPQDEERPGS
ncbi:MAG TPA: hypothetical protein VM840_05610, partial [Actinomycetota bacterium]|nr:hypothetical protein [Actinomycetota bacterium]